jgi:anti-anti-sigma factor
MSAHIVGEKAEQAGTKRRGGRSRSVHLHTAAEAVPSEPAITSQPAEPGPRQEARERLSETLDATVVDRVIRLQGPVDIASAAGLKQQLQEALQSGDEIRISLQEVSELDVTAVQLLWAARRAARAAGVGFQVLLPPAEVVGLLAEAGLESFVVAEVCG